MVSKLFLTICICLIVSIALFVVETFVIISDKRDANWELVWAYETGWFQLFTVFVAVIIVILQPDDKSDMLVQM